MSGRERKWLRGSVVLAILVASITTVTLVMIAGAVSTTSFQGGSLTGSANATMWNAATTVFNALSLTEIIIPVLSIAGAIIAILLVLTYCSAMRAGLG